MEIKAQFLALIMDNLEYVLLTMTGLLLLSLVVFIRINLKLANLNKRYQNMMRGAENANLEELLTGHIEEVRRTVTKVEKLSDQCRRLDLVAQNCVQRVSLVRYNAFENTGSDLSFALALLDSHNNGVVVSSLFGRNESRVYAKPIINGASTYFLTEEEKQALQQAAEKISS
jgi:hypothetical protein